MQFTGGWEEKIEKNNWARCPNIGFKIEKSRRNADCIVENSQETYKSREIIHWLRNAVRSKDDFFFSEDEKV